MNQTPNIGLALPRPDDFYDIEVFNQNSRIIDSLLHEAEMRRPKELAVTILTSGTFRPAEHGLAGEEVDVYLVGGGAGGHTGGLTMFQRGGGGGGFCKLLRNVRLTQASFNIVIGAGGQGSTGTGTVYAGTAGGNTTAFGSTANGGSIAWTTLNPMGGNGGSGGGGGSGGDTSFSGGDGGFGGSGGGLFGGTGGGNTEFTPINPYDGIAYGSGGGGAPAGRGGGAGGSGGTSIAPDRVNGFLGGGGGGASGVSGHATRAGNGGIGGGGGGSTAAANTLNLPAGNGGAGLVYIYARPRAGARTAGTIKSLSELCVAEYRALEKSCAESYKHIAILKDGICIDTAVFEDAKTAKSFLKAGVWSEADAVRALDPGCGIGDKWDGKQWIKQAHTEESP